MSRTSASDASVTATGPAEVLQIPVSAVRELLGRTREAALGAQGAGVALAGSDRSADLYHAWLLLGGEDPRGRRAHERLLRRLAAGGSTAPWVSLEPVPVERWPLWRTDPDEPEEMLVALGIWDHAVETLTDAFPLSEPDLAMTGGLLRTTTSGAVTASPVAAPSSTIRPPRSPVISMEPEPSIRSTREVAGSSTTRSSRAYQFRANRFGISVSI